MTTVCKELAFDAAHRLLNHEGKCRHLHGHRYTVFITCQPMKGLDSVGRVIDFSCIKEQVGGWIDTFLDHGTIINKDDLVLAGFLHKNGQKYYSMDCNPTAENIAMEIYRVASTALHKLQVTVTEVRVMETPSCGATYKVPG